MMSFKNKIYNWIRDAEHERKERLSSKSRSVTSKHSSNRKSSSISSSSRSSKDKRALQEKLRMAELLAEVEFLKKRQSARIHEENLKIEEEYAKAKGKIKIFEAIKSEDHKSEFNVDGQYKGKINKAIDEKPETQHQGTKQYHYDQVTVGDRKFNFSLMKQPLHEKVKGNQANVTKWAPRKPTGERYKRINVLDSENVSETYCELLKLKAAPEVDMEPFDGNVLNYHFMALFKEVVESKVEDPRGRLTRLLKYTRGSQRTRQLLRPIPTQ